MAGAKRSFESMRFEAACNDDDLWRAIKKGDHHAFARLYQKYIQDLLNYGLHLSKNKGQVEDAIHDVFEKVWSSKNNIGDVQSTKAYLFVALRRKLLNQSNKNKLFFAKEMQGTNEVFEVAPSHEHTLISNEKELEHVRKVRQTINRLNDKQREVVYLRFYQNLSYEEISDLLSIDQKYAYNLAYKAFQFIRQNFDSIIVTYLVFGCVWVF